MQYMRLSKKEILDMPWDCGSCVKELKDKIEDSEEREDLYKWHEDVRVESVDLSGGDVTPVSDEKDNPNKNKPNFVDKIKKSLSNLSNDM